MPRAALRTLIAALLISTLQAVPALAQADAFPGIPLFTRYELDATSLTYCRTVGEEGLPLSRGYTGRGLIETTGSSTTVTAVDAAVNSFNLVSVGDEIGVNLAGVETWRLVTAKASDDSITVDSAIDISAGSGFSWIWRKRECGTTVTDGWVPVSQLDQVVFTLQVDQIVLTAGTIDFSVECKQKGIDAGAVVVYGAATANYRSGGYPAAGTRDAIVISEYWDQCRVGTKINGTDDGDDLTTNGEQVTVHLSGRLTRGN